MECGYKFEDYPIKTQILTTEKAEDKDYCIEELYTNIEDEEYQELLKQLEEINLQELLMNTESRASKRNNNN